MKVIQKNVKDVYTKSQLPAADIVVNPYVGCMHKCIYCYACFMKRFMKIEEAWGEYLVIKDWQTKNLKKLENKTVLFSSITDPFQPLNLKYKKTQKALMEIKNSNIDTNVEILTKSKFILKELKLIKSISNIKVGISLATLNDKISKRIEPGASLSSERIQIIKTLNNEKIKCYVFISPIIPHITNVFQIIDEVYEYVDYICFENLNLRSPYKCEVLNFAKEVLPKDKYQDFERIFNDSNYGKMYWQQLEKRIEKYCQAKHVTYKMYFYHNKIRKGKNS